MADKTEFEAETNFAAALASARSEPPAAPGNSIPFVVAPEGYSVEKIEHLYPQPARKRGNVELRDMQSFCRVVKDQANAATRLYGNYTTPSFKAVFNDHGEGAGWRDHTATYSCPLSVEWKTWTGANKRAMTQEQFAQFIEDNAPDCVQPDSATMIEIARTLEAKKKVNFASGIRLSNGQSQLTYEEEISGTAGKGQIVVPEVFSIGIAALEGGPKYAVNARLRYRIADKGALTMWFDLERPHKVIEDAVREVWQAIEAETGLAILNGD